MKLMLESGQVDLKSTLQSKDMKKISTWRGLDLAAMRAEKSGVVMSNGTRPASNGHSGIENIEHS
jgi:hypothetical protein